MTVYVFAERFGADCAAEFTVAREAILRANPGAERLFERDSASPRGGHAGAGRLARYRFDAAYDGVTQPLASDVYVYCRPGSRWRVKYRMTGPANLNNDADAARILAGISWPAEVAD